MDKRRKKIDLDAERELRARFFDDIKAGNLSIGKAVREMRWLSRLTQPEFARHRDISLGSLRQIEAGERNPTVETLEKIGSIFGLEVNFTVKNKRD